MEKKLLKKLKNKHLLKKKKLKTKRIKELIQMKKKAVYKNNKTYRMLKAKINKIIFANNYKRLM